MRKSAELQFIFNALSPSENDKKLKIDPNINWNVVYTLAILHRIWHQVYAALTPIQKDIPDAVYERFTQKCQHSNLRILTTAAETVRIAREFTENHIPHCFIKGIVLNAHIYGALNTRPCKDIDVWVEPSNYRQATEKLLSLGYEKTTPAYELRGYQEQYYMSHKHDMTFYHAHRKIFIELHFKILPLGMSFFKLTTAISQPIMLMNTPIMTLQDDYNLLYLMIHGAVHAWIRLRWLNDIVLYLKSDKCDLQRVMMLAKEIKSEHMVEQSLLLIQNNFGDNDTSLSQLMIKPSKRGVKIARAAQTFIENEFEFTESYSIYNKRFYYQRLYLVKLSSPRQWLKIMLGGLIEIDEMFPYVKLSKRFAFMYYILCPFLILKRRMFRLKSTSVAQ